MWLPLCLSYGILTYFFEKLKFVFKSLLIFNLSYNFINIDHVERKVPKYEYHQIRERKVKTLTRNWRDHWRIGTRKLYRDISTGTAVFINQKIVNVCEHMTKMASLDSLWKVPPGVARGMDGGKLSEVNARTESRR